MQIRYIDNLADFDKLKSSWRDIYAADQHATSFLSWAWLRGWFQVTQCRWLVLACRPDGLSTDVGFLAINRDTTIPKYRFDLLRELRMGGSPLADYTGFVCSPDYETKAVEGFAEHIRTKLDWDVFHMDQVVDPRLDSFLDSFPSKHFKMEERSGTPSMFIALPHTWDEYFHGELGKRTRRDLRRSFREMENRDEFQIAHVTADNVDSHIETLLELYQANWGRKSTYNLNRFRVIFRKLFEDDSLWLAVLSHSNTPIAALAAMCDRQKKTFAAYIAGYGRDEARLSPGKTLFGYSIKYAIENRFEIYDFLKGDEGYKNFFAATTRFARNIVLTRNSLRLQFGNLVRDSRLRLREAVTHGRSTPGITSSL
jgi:CelD/BcsL family acetyltransferase involved in cellulose biosynthesis